MEELKINETIKEIPVVPCSECKRKTHHIVLASADRNGREPMGNNETIFWKSHYQLIQCQGCKTISFRRVYTNSEDMSYDGEGGMEYSVHESLYPRRIEGRSPLTNSHFLPFTVYGIYQETIDALTNEQTILCGIGIRALIEAVCVEKSAIGYSLNDKINDLVSKGVLTKRDADILHKLRTLGNKAAHEVKPHSEEQLSLALDIVEHLLEGVYILERRAKTSFGDDEDNSHSSDALG